MDGHRLAIPPRDQLPGPDTASFAGLDAYIALMQRCWAQVRPVFAWLHPCICFAFRPYGLGGAQAHNVLASAF